MAGQPGWRVSFDELIILSAAWPVLLCAGLLLGGISMWSVQRRVHLLWFLPTLLLAAIAFVLVTSEAANVLILAPERLGIGVIALFPAVVLSFMVVWCLLRFRAKGWLLFSAPAMLCLLSAPLAGFLARVAVCELVGDCP